MTSIQKSPLNTWGINFKAVVDNWHPHHRHRDTKTDKQSHWNMMSRGDGAESPSSRWRGLVKQARRQRTDLLTSRFNYCHLDITLEGPV